MPRRQRHTTSPLPGEVGHYFTPRHRLAFNSRPRAFILSFAHDFGAISMLRAGRPAQRAGVRSRLRVALRFFLALPAYALMPTMPRIATRFSHQYRKPQGPYRLLSPLPDYRSTYMVARRAAPAKRRLRATTPYLAFHAFLHRPRHRSP